MTQFHNVNVKLSSSKLNKLKLGTKISTKGAVSLSSNMIGNSINATNFAHNLLLNDILNCYTL